jgi:transcriptional regulator with XRE-family HTH domain
MRPGARYDAIDMPTDSATLIIRCRDALGLSQKEFGALVGRDRRTIQRWEERGCMLLPDEAQVIADAVRPVDPELADPILVLGGKTAAGAGLAAPVLPASPEVIERIRKDAARAMNTSPRAVRPAIVAAFTSAVNEGVAAKAVLDGLKAGK